ncbi:hypothetical protein MMC06_002694 [Schaereria dolodes]|nr:hypothetical protein [Schaereria dolodes]
MDTSMGASRISKRLILSYAFDWLIIILIIVVGAAFTKISPNHRPFSLTDPTISFPYVVKEKVSTATLVLVSCIAPAIIIALVCLVFVPGPTVPKDTPKRLVWRRKLWEWNTAWMGLGLALASAFFLTDAMKNLFGKPRPDLLNRCQPDVANVGKYAIGGYDNSVSGDILLVSWTVCQQPNLSILNDGFASFPSGHSSFAFAGLTYLSLFLCAKFAIAIPYLLPSRYNPSALSSSLTTRHSRSPSSSSPNSKDTPLTPRRPLNTTSSSSSTKILRSQAAAPPTYLIVLAFIPIGTALYIASTRWSDFKHHGFDIIFGSLMGFLLAWGSFRWYHAPIRRGAGWSWGARSVAKAWGVGVGVQGYAGDGELGRETLREDLEMGRVEGRENGIVGGEVEGTM